MMEFTRDPGCYGFDIVLIFSQQRYTLYWVDKSKMNAIYKQYSFLSKQLVTVYAAS